MSAMIHDAADHSRGVQFSNGHFERLLLRGVLMPAGVFAANVQYFYFSGGNERAKSWEQIRGTEAEARGCAMAMRAFAGAVRLAGENQRPWVDRLDRELADQADDLVELLATCRGFEVS